MRKIIITPKKLGFRGNPKVFIKMRQLKDKDLHNITIMANLPYKKGVITPCISLS